MEDHLQNIRDEHPHLNPTETYKLLGKAMTPEVAEREMDHEDFIDALDQYEERLNDQLLSLKDRLKPEYAQDMLGEEFDKWFADLQDDHQDLDSRFDDIKNIGWDLPDEARIAEIVDEKIQKDYPEFHQQYREHQQWLKTNEERLARQEQRSFEGETDQTRNMDGRTR